MEAVDRDVESDGGSSLTKLEVSNNLCGIQRVGRSRLVGQLGLVITRPVIAPPRIYPARHERSAAPDYSLWKKQSYSGPAECQILLYHSNLYTQLPARIEVGNASVIHTPPCSIYNKYRLF